MDVFRRAFLAGLGAMSMSRERGKALVNELVKAGELQEKEGKKLLDEMARAADEVRGKVESTIAKQMAAAYKHLNLTSADQLKKMECRIRELEKELAKTNRTARAARSTAKKAAR